MLSVGCVGSDGVKLALDAADVVAVAFPTEGDIRTPS